MFIKDLAKEIFPINKIYFKLFCFNISGERLQFIDYVLDSQYYVSCHNMFLILFPW